MVGDEVGITFHGHVLFSLLRYNVFDVFSRDATSAVHGKKQSLL